MGISPLVPVAGAALGALAAKTWERLADIPTFLEVWQAGNAETRVADSDTEEARGSTEIGTAASRGWLELEEAREASSGQLQAELARFEQRLRQRLSRAGIETNVPIELKSDGNGGVMLHDEHPDRAAIEALFAADPGLCEDFQFLATSCAAEGLLHGQADRFPDSEFRLRLDTSGVHPVFD